MIDSVNISSFDRSIIKPDVTTQIVTNNDLNVLPTVTLESGERLTNVFVDDPFVDMATASTPVLTKKKVAQRGSFFRIVDKIQTSIISVLNRNLFPIFKKNNFPAVLPGTNKGLLLLSYKKGVAQKPVHLPNPLSDDYSDANFDLITMLHNYRSGIPSECNSNLRHIANNLSKAWHLSDIDPLVLTSYDFSTMVATIRKLRERVGLSELVVMLLLALILKKKLYTERGWKSDAAFFRSASEIMGISSSRARDYSKRGNVLLKYYTDLFEGIGEVAGIPPEDFVVSHMSKLTIYEKAVEKFGREGALKLLKSLTFREFQAKVAVLPKKDSKSDQTHVIRSKSSDSSPNVHQEQIKMINDMHLAPNEKRLLRIIAKGGIYCCTKYLTEEQVVEVETRLRQMRVEIIKNNLGSAPKSFKREGFDPNNPLAFSEKLFKLFNIDDIILRIRSGLALIVPARRTIAILLYRLFNEKRNEWQNPFDGPKYKNFRDFASDKLGMGEEYRDYLRVGKVIMSHYYFLNGLTDIDINTEDMFFKLRYLEAALKTHKDNEPLVLARLRTLTIREFKIFSELPDFEITFSKKLTRKQLKMFREALDSSRAMERSYLRDFIEIYSPDEESRVYKIVNDVLFEAGTLMDPPKKRIPIHEMTIDSLPVQQSFHSVTMS
jgi:hypothetical protein